MIGSLINCIIISKHSDFLPAVNAPESRQILCSRGGGRPLSHCRWRATGAGLPHSHSAPYWLQPPQPTRERYPWHFIQQQTAKGRAKGGGVHLCTEPWDTQRMASPQNMKRIFFHVFGSPCNAHAYSISGMHLIANSFT